MAAVTTGGDTACAQVQSRDAVGSIYLMPAVTKEVLETIQNPKKERVELTPRQRDVLRLIVQGNRMKEIATILDLSTRTVEAHKYEMMRTLGVQSTAELVRYPKLVRTHLGFLEACRDYVSRLLTRAPYLRRRLVTNAATPVPTSRNVPGSGTGLSLKSSSR